MVARPLGWELDKLFFNETWVSSGLWSPGIVAAAGRSQPAACAMMKCLLKSQHYPSDSNVAQFLWGKGSVFAGDFHSVRLVIIRLEIGSEAVCSLVALVTT